MVKYEVIISKERVDRNYDAFMRSIASYLKVSAKNGTPVRTISVVARQLGRMKKHFRGTSEINNQKERTKEEANLEKLCIEIINIDPGELIDIGLITVETMKKALIKIEYAELAKRQLKYKYIKEMLSVKYDISISAIEKLIYKK